MHSDKLRVVQSRDEVQVSSILENLFRQTRIDFSTNSGHGRIASQDHTGRWWLQRQRYGSMDSKEFQHTAL